MGRRSSLDQITWTAIVYVSGGASSGATSFYALTCLVGAILVGRRGAAVAAAPRHGDLRAALRRLSLRLGPASGRPERRRATRRAPATSRTRCSSTRSACRSSRCSRATSPSASGSPGEPAGRDRARPRGRAAGGARPDRRGPRTRDPQPAGLDHRLDRDAARVPGAVGRGPTPLRHRASRGAPAQRSGRRHGRPVEAPAPARRGDGRRRRSRARWWRWRTNAAARLGRRRALRGTRRRGPSRAATGHRCGRCCGTWCATRMQASPAGSTVTVRVARAPGDGHARGRRPGPRGPRGLSARASSRTSSRREPTAPGLASRSCGASSKTTRPWGPAIAVERAVHGGASFRVTLSPDVFGLRQSVRPPPS